MDLLRAILVRDVPDLPRPTPLQRLQLDLLDLVRRSYECDEETALAFRDYLVLVAAREGARGR
jgi:hypothetical protein